MTNDYVKIWRYEPKICLNCATSIPGKNVLVGKENGSVYEYCPVCQRKTVVDMNKLLQQNDRLRKYIKAHVVTHPGGYND